MKNATHGRIFRVLLGEEGHTSRTCQTQRKRHKGRVLHVGWMGEQLCW